MAADGNPDRLIRLPGGLASRDRECLEIAGACDCRAAVVRAWRGMRDSGAEEIVARSVALRVFRYHHPAVEAELARETVAGWLRAAVLH